MTRRFVKSRGYVDSLLDKIWTKPMADGEKSLTERMANTR